MFLAAVLIASLPVGIQIRVLSSPSRGKRTASKTSVATWASRFFCAPLRVDVGAPDEFVAVNVVVFLVSAECLERWKCLKGAPKWKPVLWDWPCYVKRHHLLGQCNP